MLTSVVQRCEKQEQIKVNASHSLSPSFPSRQVKLQLTAIERQQKQDCKQVIDGRWKLSSELLCGYCFAIRVQCIF